MRAVRLARDWQSGSALLALAAAAIGSLALAPGCNGEFRFDEPAVDAGLDAPTADQLDASDGTHDADAARPPVKCTNDEPCEGLGMRCDKSQGVCVACLGDAECPTSARPLCDTTLHVCIACKAPTDCAPNHTCETTTHRCIDSCFDTDDPCPLAGHVCDTTRKFCIECLADSDCTSYASRKKCNTASGQCVVCVTNAQCSGAKPVCDPRSGTCVGCVTSNDCQPGQGCPPATQVCTTLEAE